MKLAIKYGAIIAAGIAVWVVADHTLLHITRPGSRVSLLTPIFFNLLQFVVLFLGIRARRLERRGSITMRQGIGTGMAISLAYAVLSSIFFALLYLAIGSRLLENESTPFGANQSEGQVLIGAFAGLFFGALFGGLIYSVVISFALRGDPRSPART